MYELSLYQDINRPDRFLEKVISPSLPKVGDTLVEDLTGTLIVTHTWRTGSKLEWPDSNFPQRHIVLVNKSVKK